MVTLAFPDENPRGGADWPATRAGLIRRHDTAARLVPLECGLSDPWLRWCDEDEELSESRLDNLAAAYRHVLECGYTPVANWPALRRLWRRGGADRALSLLVSWLCRGSER